MSAEIVPIDFHTETLHKVVGWANELRAMLEANKVSALVVRGVDSDGEVIEFSIIPDQAPTVRYILIGQLQDAVADLCATKALEPPKAPAA